jgi:hypothetical protein
MSGRVRNWALAGWAALTVALLAFAAVVEFRETVWQANGRGP